MVGGVEVDDEASCRGLWSRRVEVDSGVTRVGDVVDIEFGVAAAFVMGVLVDGFEPAVSSVIKL